MKLSLKKIESLIGQINGGHAHLALTQINGRIKHGDKSKTLLVLKAHALVAVGKVEAAVTAFQEAAIAGVEGSWLKAGVLLAGLRKLPEALNCYHKALVQAPQNPEVFDAIVTALFNNGQQAQGILFARILLQKEQATPHQRKNAALLLSSNGLHDLAAPALKLIINQAGKECDPSIIGPALSCINFTCDWDFLGQIRESALSHYRNDQFEAIGEYPLTNLTWCDDEAINLGVTQAYARRSISAVEPLALGLNSSSSRLRVGYLSNDFRNHATLHLMIGLFEHHDERKFEIFAYDYSQDDASEYRQRFLTAIEHHRDISGMTDMDAATLIANDRIDILIDLKGHTGLARPNILAYRPALVQASYLGFPGSTGLSCVDYVVTDRQVTPDDSAKHYTERLCRLPNSYQCNESAQAIIPSSKSRDDFDLPQGKVVFCSFNQAYKIDSTSIDIWLTILQNVTDSILWLLVDQSEQAKTNLLNKAREKGVDARRLVFAKPVAPIDHRERIQFADIALDTLICNGHTTTSDMLRWGGVPVVTARGKHFASRVSQSLLYAMDLPELVGLDHEDMIKIACELGNNREKLQAIRKKIMERRSNAALFDVFRFTRNFEKALSMMTQHNGPNQRTQMRILDVYEHK